MTWTQCVLDSDYEISDEFPYPIRRIGTDTPIAESIATNGYVQCTMNLRKYKKHRIIAEQFIDNPDNLPDVDHINHDRSDNHIENLRWTNRSDNNRNRSTSGRGNHQYTFLDELPDTAESLDSYGKHDLDGVFIDYESEKLYIYNGVRYRELVPIRGNGNIRYTVSDIEGKRSYLAHKVLFG